MKRVTGRVRDFFGKMNKRLRRLLIVIVILTVAAVAGLLVYRSTRPYTVLFTGLSQEDMTSVLTYLAENNVIDYKIENNDTVEEAKVPILGDIPGIGFFFRTTHTNREKRELVILITPHIIDEGADVATTVQNQSL